jgi:hypothetical protein
MDFSLTCRYARIFPNSQLLLCNTMEAFGKRKELKNALTVFGALKGQLGGINMFACRSIIDICGHCGSSVQARIIFEVLDIPHWPQLISLLVEFVCFTFIDISICFFDFKLRYI